MFRFPRNKKQTYLLNSMPQMWPSNLNLAMTLAMNFQGQIWNMLYLIQRLFHCHIMKNTYIEWTEGLNYNQVWPWPWKVRCKDLLDSDRDDLKYRRTDDSSSLCNSQITTCSTFNSIEDVIFLPVHHYPHRRRRKYSHYYNCDYHYYHHNYHIIHRRHHHLHLMQDQIYINTASAMSTFIRMFHGNKWL